MEELKFNIGMNKMAMERLREKIQQAMKGLDSICDDGQVGGYDYEVWTQGHAAMMIAEMTGLITRQHALQEALYIIEKQ